MTRPWMAYVAGVTTGLLVAGGSAVMASSHLINIPVYFNGIKIKVNGEQIEMPQQPFIYEGRTYVPVRFVSEALSQAVGWEAESSTVLIGSGVSMPMADAAELPTDQGPVMAKGSYVLATGQTVKNALRLSLKGNERGWVYPITVKPGFHKVRGQMGLEDGLDSLHIVMIAVDRRGVTKVIQEGDLGQQGWGLTRFFDITLPEGTVAVRISAQQADNRVGAHPVILAALFVAI